MVLSVRQGFSVLTRVGPCEGCRLNQSGRDAATLQGLQVELVVHVLDLAKRATEVFLSEVRPICLSTNNQLSLGP